MMRFVAKPMSKECRTVQATCTVALQRLGQRLRDRRLRFAGLEFRLGYEIGLTKCCGSSHMSRYDANTSACTDLPIGLKRNRIAMIVISMTVIAKYERRLIP